MKLSGIPAVIYGEPSDRVFLFVHGKCGCKEEAEAFATLACPRGWQVVGIDLPEHGERKGQAPAMEPWNVIPELQALMSELRHRWQQVGIRANSIGAWFCMQSFAQETIERCLFVSPILDMAELIEQMMQWASVSEQMLRERGRIETEFGETLSWRYREFAKAHPIAQWRVPTAILYAGQDNLTPRRTVQAFCDRHGCERTVSEDSEHWFHTPEQLEVLRRFELAHL